MDWRRQQLSERQFWRRYRMRLENFERLCERLRPQLTGDKRGAKSVEPEVKLSATLRYLCGAKMVDIEDIHGLAESGARTSVDACLEAIDDWQPPLLIARTPSIPGCD